MKGKNLFRRIGGFVLAASLLFAVAIMPNTAVQAQGRGGHGGGFHREFRGGGFHREFRGGGFRPRIFIGPRFSYGYPYGYYGYPTVIPMGIPTVIRIRIGIPTGKASMLSAIVKSRIVGVTTTG